MGATASGRRGTPSSVPPTARRGRPITVAVLATALLTALLSFPVNATAVSSPDSPAGMQLAWFLGTTARLPLAAAEISAHFDAQFLAHVPTAELNAVLAETPGPMRLLAVSASGEDDLTADVAVAGITLKVQMSVDASGLIDGLLLTPIVAPVFTSWTSIDHELATVAPGVGLLAAEVGKSGTCEQRHAVRATTPRPIGSLFKLYVLGALANAVHRHRIRWDEPVTITAASKVGGSGTLVNVPDGTRLSVERLAELMISDSDNTAADLLMGLVGRRAVEAEVAQWSTHAALDVPFLTVSELFALKYDAFPLLADHYLSLSRAERAAYLSSTVDKVDASQEQPTTEPRDINTIEWFASPEDICRAFSGLARLDQVHGLGPVGIALSLNDGGIGLSKARWPSVWFKGGSESGVLTLAYRARASTGRTFVVVVMVENPTSAFAEELVTTKLLDVASSAFALLRRSR